MDMLLANFLMVVGVLGGGSGLFIVAMGHFLPEIQEGEKDTSIGDMKHTKKFYKYLGWILTVVCVLCFVIGLIGHLMGKPRVV